MTRGKKDGFSGERALVLPPNILKEVTSDLIYSSLHITAIGYYPKAEKHYIERGESISQYVLIYCVEGAGFCVFKENKIKIKKDHCFILPAHVPHKYGASKSNPWTIYWMHFKGKLASQFAEGFPTPLAIKPNLYSRINERVRLFEEIFHTLEMGYSKDNLLYSSSALMHFLGSLRFLHQYRNAYRNSDQEEDMVTAAIHYMKENIEHKMSLSNIAAHTGYSSSHFSSLFFSQTGYSPINYFNQLKIQQACHYLDFSEMKVNQISFKVGIEDSYYFSRLFKKIMGVSPNQYKKRMKG